jgi:hypothetical protein
VGDCAHFETEPVAIQLPLPPVNAALNMELAFDETNHLPNIVTVEQDSDFGQAFPSHFRQNVHILDIDDHDPVTIEDVPAALNSKQNANAVVSIGMWIIKRNSYIRTDIEEQHMMYGQVRFVPVLVPSLPEPITCRDVASLHKADYPGHIDQRMKSPFKAGFKGAHFENYDNMYSTGTWSHPVLRSLIPAEAVFLPIRTAYAVTSTNTESIWDLQVRSCANEALMQQGVHFYQSSSPVASIENIHILLNLGASQGKSVFVLDVKNAFQNTIQCDPSKRNYTMLPPFVLEYLRLHWPDHPELAGIEQYSHLYALQNFRSTQG